MYVIKEEREGPEAGGGAASELRPEGSTGQKAGGGEPGRMHGPEISGTCGQS